MVSYLDGWIVGWLDTRIDYSYVAILHSYLVRNICEKA